MATVHPSVFIGSSVQGKSIAKAVQNRLAGEADPEVWDQATFDVGDTTIDSLEKKSREVDFAIFVLTPDDVLIKKAERKAAPRDNVIFELGLFSGSLGRQRCFLVHDEAHKLDLPTDLLGITAARFKMQGSGDLEASVAPACNKIEKVIGRLGVRPKLDPKALSSFQEIDAFRSRATGYWWQRVLPDDASALSFMQIEPDAASGTLKMGGISYHTDGSPVAQWRTTGVSILKDDRKIAYIWEGSHPKSPNDPYQGFGWVQFDDVPGSFTKGIGGFFNANLADLKTARKKSGEYRRVTSEKERATMRDGSGKQIAALVKAKLEAW